MRRLFRSLQKDATQLRALIADPVQSRSYYPEKRRKAKFFIVADLLWWWLRYREANQYYYLYGLDRADANRDAVMPYCQFRALRNSRNLRPGNLSAYYGSSYNFVCLLRDKFLFSQLAESLNIPSPKVRAVCTPESLLWVETGELRSYENLLADRSLRVDAVCKPADGIMGSDVFLLKIEDGRLFIGGAEASAEDFRRKLKTRHILQDRISQHAALSRLYGLAINTLRLVTYNQDGAVSLFSAGFRVGTGGAHTDNWSAGGILLAIDPQSGRVQGEGYMKPAFGLRVACHPDSGIQFDGFEVPDFQKAADLVCGFHTYLPGIHSIGWDVAITPEGPVVVEGNDDWDGAVSMVLDPQFRERFTAMYDRAPRNRLEKPETRLA